MVQLQAVMRQPPRCPWIAATGGVWHNSIHPREAGTDLPAVSALVIEDRGAHTFHVGGKPSHAQGGALGRFSLLRLTFGG